MIRHYRYVLSLTLLMTAFLPSMAQSEPTVVRELKQQSFPEWVPAGNYSGITSVGENTFAVVDDKSTAGAFCIFHIVQDKESGRIDSISFEGFRGTQTESRDAEGIAFNPHTGTLFISGEKDNRILEYDMEGKLTGRELAVPDEFHKATSNYGLESLTYNAATHLFWTTSESTLPKDGEQATSTNKAMNELRLQSFGDDLMPKRQYRYVMDVPVASSKAGNYAMGVSDLLALDDGTVIVLEREFFVPPMKIGAFVVCKLYAVKPTEHIPYGEPLTKRLLGSYRTQLSLFKHEVANYEGMTLGAQLNDGSQSIILVSDSQNQYAGVLKDFFKVIVLRNE